MKLKSLPLAAAALASVGMAFVCHAAATGLLSDATFGKTFWGPLQRSGATTQNTASSGPTGCGPAHPKVDMTMLGPFADSFRSGTDKRTPAEAVTDLTKKYDTVVEGKVTGVESRWGDLGGVYTRVDALITATFKNSVGGLRTGEKLSVLVPSGVALDPQDRCVARVGPAPVPNHTYIIFLSKRAMDGAFLATAGTQWIQIDDNLHVHSLADPRAQSQAAKATNLQEILAAVKAGAGN